MFSRSLLPFFVAWGAPLVLTGPATAQAPTSIPSRVVRVVEFDDRGRTYRVELDSGRVSFTESGNVIPPAPEPPKPDPPKPGPALTGLALRVNQAFREKFPTDTAFLAGELVHAIDVTLAKSGGLNIKGQDILADLRKTCDDIKLTPFIKGFPLGDILRVACGDDPEKIIPALKEAKVGLEAVK